MEFLLGSSSLVRAKEALLVVGRKLRLLLVAWTGSPGIAGIQHFSSRRYRV